jgi:acyl-coenzyme A thioesterase PaaI-like protein
MVLVDCASMSLPDYVRAIWRNPAPGRLMGPGHPAGDFLEGPNWLLLEEEDGRLLVDAPLVDAAKNFRGQLFGGFAPAYIDLIALRTVSAGRAAEPSHGWLVTLNLHVEYFEPIGGPRFLIESQVVTRRGRTIFVEVRFRQARESNQVLLFASTLLLEQR